MSCAKRKKMARRAAQLQVSETAVIAETTIEFLEDLLIEEAAVVQDPPPEAQDEPEGPPVDPGSTEEAREIAEVTVRKPTVKKKSYKQK